MLCSVYVILLHIGMLAPLGLIKTSVSSNTPARVGAMVTDLARKWEKETIIRRRASNLQLVFSLHSQFVTVYQKLL